MRRGLLGIVSLVVLLWVCALHGVPAAAGVNGWSPTGLQGGDVSALAIDGANPQVVYAGTGSGGVFVSRDAGATWRATSAGLGDLHVHDLDIDPLSPTILYATTSSGVYASTDGAVNWSPASAGLRGEPLALAIEIGRAHV